LGWGSAAARLLVVSDFFGYGLLSPSFSAHVRWGEGV